MDLKALEAKILADIKRWALCAQSVAGFGFTTSAEVVRRHFAAAIAAEQGDSATWKPGPPPRRDDGDCVIVRLKRENLDDQEYYGDPVVVSCHDSKLKTTLVPTRIEYADVAEWCELPVASHGHGEAANIEAKGDK